VPQKGQPLTQKMVEILGIRWTIETDFLRFHIFEISLLDFDPQPNAPRCRIQVHQQFFPLSEGDPISSVYNKEDFGEPT